jgi:hypothetical protein
MGSDDDVHSLMGIGLHPEPARVAEREDEEMRRLGPLPDPQAQLAEIDLALLAGGRLVAHRGDGRPAARRPPRLHVPLHLKHAGPVAQGA